MGDRGATPSTASKLVSKLEGGEKLNPLTGTKYRTKDKRPNE